MTYHCTVSQFDTQSGEILHLTNNDMISDLLSSHVHFHYHTQGLTRAS